MSSIVFLQHEQNKCVCGQESAEKFKQILANYEGVS